MDITGRRFVVFGGAGFVGSHVVNLLTREPVKQIVIFDKIVRKENIAAALPTGRVLAIEGDVARSEEVLSVLQENDGVFHLAALPINSCLEMPRACFDINVLGTFSILEAAQKAGIKKIVFSSASSVYGDTNELMNEAHPLNARTMYGASKIAGEYFLRAFHDMYGLDYVALRYMNVYGPNQQGGVVMAVLKRIQQGLPPIIIGDGTQSFDFIYVEDVARANIMAMKSEVTDEVLNIGSGTEVTVKEMVSRLLEVTGSPLVPIFERSRNVLMRRRVGSSEKAKRLLGFESRIEIEEGLRSVAKSLGMCPTP